MVEQHREDKSSDLRKKGVVNCVIDPSGLLLTVLSNIVFPVASYSENLAKVSFKYKQPKPLSRLQTAALSFTV